MTQRKDQKILQLSKTANVKQSKNTSSLRREYLWVLRKVLVKIKDYIINEQKSNLLS